MEILNSHGFKTFESCQGEEGHAFLEPTVRLEGDEFDLIRACDIYRDDNTPNVRQIGETWYKPFNGISALHRDDHMTTIFNKVGNLFEQSITGNIQWWYE